MVTAKNITKRYGEITALNDLSFEVEPGSLFGFIGPDGAGKTSLFRILTSLILPDEGQVRVDGLDVVADYRKLRQIVGYMSYNFV